MKLNYFPLDQLKTFLGYENLSYLYDFEACKEKVFDNYANGKEFKLYSNLISSEELISFLSLIKGDENLIFDQWICGNNNLFLLITENKLLKNDFQLDKYENHFLFYPFIKFVSPFLTAVLLRNFDSKKEKELVAVSSYIPLLTKDDSFIIQTKLVSFVSSQWKIVESKFPSLNTENELVQEIGFYFSKEKIELLNYLTKEFYSSKIELIEQGLAVFKHPFTSNRLAFWVIKQLNLLELNSEHKEKLKTISNSIKIGENIYFKRISTTKSNFPIIKVSIYTSIIILFGLTLIYFINQNKYAESELSRSAFENFSKEERIRMDSLLQTIQPKKSEANRKFDSGNGYLHLTPLGIELKNRNPYKNEKIEKFLSNEVKIQDLISTGKIDSCSKLSSKYVTNLSIYDFDKFENKKGKNKVFLKNESEYQVIILNYENNSGKKVYFHLLNTKEEVIFFSETNSSLIFLPGKNFGKVFSKDSNFENPFHFCFVDENYEKMLFESFEIKSNFNEKIKIQFNNSVSKGFYFIDVYNSLEHIEN